MHSSLHIRLLIMNIAWHTLAASSYIAFAPYGTEELFAEGFAVHVVSLWLSGNILKNAVQ